MTVLIHNLRQFYTPGGAKEISFRFFRQSNYRGDSSSWSASQVRNTSGGQNKDKSSSAIARPFRPHCSYCNKDNHVVGNCFKRKRDNAQIGLVRSAPLERELLDRPTQTK